MWLFSIMRKAAFAAHSLSHISLTGASAAALIGISTLTGQLVANFIAAVKVVRIITPGTVNTLMAIYLSLFCKHVIEKHKQFYHKR